MNEGITFSKPSGEVVSFKTLDDALNYFEVSRATFYRQLEGAKTHPWRWIGLTPEQRKFAWKFHLPEVDDGWTNFTLLETTDPPLSEFED